MKNGKDDVIMDTYEDTYEECRIELDKLIEEKNFDMSDSAIIHKALELENLMFGYTKT